MRWGLAFAALLVLLLAATADAQVPVSDAARRDALARAVTGLPRAAPGRWSDWLTAEVPRPYAGALAAYRDDDLAATFALALECLDEAPDHPAALSLVGGVAFRLRRYEDTIAAFERFLEHAPDAVARTRHLGHAYHSVGRHADARAHYDRVLAAPELGDAARRESRFGRALACYRLGAVDAARADLDAVVAESPDDAEAWTWLATLDFEAEDLARARERAARAEALAPFDPQPVFLRARVLGEQLALESAPEDDAAGQLRAELAAAEARFTALAAAEVRARDLDATLLLAPDDVDARVAAAQLALEVGDGRAAVRHAAKLASLAGERPDAQLVVLTALERHGRPESAAAHAALLEERFSGAADVLDALAAFHARRGDIHARLRCGARAAELRARR